jgi:glutamyl-tRNA reductase
MQQNLVQQTSLQTFYCLGANHTTASVEERESFFIKDEDLRALVSPLKERFHLSEIFILSTCNRFEIYAIIPSLDHQSRSYHEVKEQIESLMLTFWKSLYELGRYGTPKIAKGHYYFLHAESAIHHAFRVAASLDSLVTGETQIIGQFKDALASAQECGWTGTLLSRLGNEALAYSKKIRSQTAIGRQTVSISHLAVSIAQRLFHDLSHCRFLIVGAGDMARLALEYAQSYRPSSLCVVNRSIDRAQELAQSIPGTVAFGLQQLPKQLLAADVVIVATGASTPIITKDFVKNAIGKAGLRQPLLFVDISLPRNVDPAVVELDDVFLFDIDDLKSVAQSGTEDRQQAAREAESIITDGVKQFQSWLQTQAHVPVMEAWRDHVKGTLGRELHRTLSKDLFQSLNEDQKKQLEAMIQSMTAKLSSDLAQTLRQTSDPSVASHLASSVGQAFGLSIVGKFKS